MNSSISNSLKWLFYLMHFPYSSWTKGASQGMKGRWPHWWTSSCSTHKVLRVCVCMCPSERLGRAPVDCGSLLHRGWEREFYSVWLLKDGSCNWPSTRSLSSLEAGRGGGLNSRCGAQCQCFFPLSLGFYLAVKKHTEAYWALVGVLKMSPLVLLCAFWSCNMDILRERH